MPTHKQRILAALRGEIVDVLPYVPRIDLWYLANMARGTLPAAHRGRTQNEVSRAEGWALHHKYADDLLGGCEPDDYLHRGLGVFRIKEMVVEFEMPADVEVRVRRGGESLRVEYHTPLGMVHTTCEYTADMQRRGISIPHITEHLIRSPADYPAAGYLFEHMRVLPRFDRFRAWTAELGEDGVPVAAAFHGASPMQQIQRDLIDPTQFYFHYQDHQPLIRALAERIEPLFERILEISVQSPAEVVMWGANFDDMLTYPPYFAREIQPWVRRAAERLGAAGKLVMCHTDGENHGLMDLIRDSGMHIAESICPFPMTRVTLAEYYRRWSGHLTLFGGIPSTLVMPDQTSNAEFEAFLDDLFRAVAPGRRMVVGIADQVPPGADFDRLKRIGERIAREGRLPLQAGGFRPTLAAVPSPVSGLPAREGAEDPAFAVLREAIASGDGVSAREHARALLASGVAARAVLQHGLVGGMEVIGLRFGSGEAFIPEVLLASRAMSETMPLLEPLLAADESRVKGRVLIGTVRGDLHSIGKNIVATVLKGVGFEVLDLGTNVSRETFLDKVAEFRPDILGLSALLTTTMTEMRDVIAGLEEVQLRGSVKVMVGGAPVSAEFARDIGADGFAQDAVEAARLAKTLLGQGMAEPAERAAPLEAAR